MINYLTEAEIKEKVNQKYLMGTFGPINLDNYMSVIRSSNDTIIRATSLTVTWYGETDVDAITEEDLAAAEDGIPVIILIRFLTARLYIL